MHIQCKDRQSHILTVDAEKFRIWEPKVKVQFLEQSLYFRPEKTDNNFTMTIVYYYGFKSLKHYLKWCFSEGLY